jgi:hypothetical protein
VKNDSFTLILGKKTSKALIKGEHRKRKNRCTKENKFSFRLTELKIPPAMSMWRFLENDMDFGKRLPPYNIMKKCSTSLVINVKYGHA